TVEKYSGLVRKIRETLPDVMLTTDLIVGFPGETEEEYMDSYNMLKELRFDIVHTAAYSPREGTKAAIMDCQIDNRVKARRLNEINDMQSQLARELNEEYTGRTLQILADGFAPRGEGLIQGRTMSDKVVILPGSEADFGKTLSVKITRASHWSLEGERIQQ
ncbi:MAG: TRAM domain-containing protein, partial [Synergistaceae bacterium]|nr:TRAM domain-containing protein [Synergistaceae bacterium]